MKHLSDSDGKLHQKLAERTFDTTLPLSYQNLTLARAIRKAVFVSLRRFTSLVTFLFFWYFRFLYTALDIAFKLTCEPSAWHKAITSCQWIELCNICIIWHLQYLFQKPKINPGFTVKFVKYYLYTWNISDG